MSNFPHLHGVYAAALTPLKDDYSVDLDAFPQLLGFLKSQGCHGALLLGTTGEGPSFSPTERIAIYRVAAAFRQQNPGFRILAGTGTPSLTETIDLTRLAFEHGLDGVITLPPYYYKKVTDDGLFAWFSAVIQQAVPSGGALFGYHIPAVSGVGLSIDLLARLKDAFPDRFAGLKDSTGDPEHARQLGARFGTDLLVYTGNDRLLSLALENQASGCITAMANIFSAGLRRIWDGYQNGSPNPADQDKITAQRLLVDKFPPAPSLLKALLHRLHGLPGWPVRPALMPTPKAVVEAALNELAALE
jgi:4-hydroxy-tetrahydrodipicolinate synthase